MTGRMGETYGPSESPCPSWGRIFLEFACHTDPLNDQYRRKQRIHSCKFTSDSTRIGRCRH